MLQLSRFARLNPGWFSAEVRYVANPAPIASRWGDLGWDELTDGARELALLLTIAVIVITLFVQGFTPAPLLRRVGFNNSATIVTSGFGPARVVSHRLA